MPGYHDYFFKQVFSTKEHAIDFLKHSLPSEIVKNLDFKTFCLENVSYVDEKLAEHFADMVYSCHYKSLPVKIAILFEHKSFPDNYMPFQLLKYMVRIWDLNIKQNQSFMPVVPMVLYHGKEKWQPGHFRAVFHHITSELKQFIPDFEYIFINLAKYSDNAIKEEIFETESLKISLLVLKNIFYPEKLEPGLKDLFSLGYRFFQSEKGLKFLEIIISYLYQATEIETESIINAIVPVTRKGGEIAMTTAEKLRQEGLQKGRQEGIYNTYYTLIHNMNKNNLSDKDIAKLINIDIEVVKKVLNKEQFEIPLHLLDRSY